MANLFGGSTASSSGGGSSSQLTAIASTLGAISDSIKNTYGAESIVSNQNELEEIFKETSATLEDKIQGLTDSQNNAVNAIVELTTDTKTAINSSASSTVNAISRLSTDTRTAINNSAVILFL